MTLFGRSVADLLPTHANSFNVVRLVAALAVIVSHAYPIALGRGAIEPLAAFTPFTLGQHAVNAFFVVSGLLLANSLDRDGDLLRFLAARALRIVPGLFVYGLLFALVVAPLLTPLPLAGYFADTHALTYPFAVLAQFDRAVPPHGMFADIPYPGAVNAPLWTIPYELGAYVVLATLFGVRALRTARGAAVFVALAVIGVLTIDRIVPADSWGHYTLHQLARYALCFVLGVAAFHFRGIIRTGPVLLIPTFLALLLARGTLLSPVLYIGFTAQVVLTVAAIDFGKLSRWARRNDVSYGIYIYGWPTEQVVVSMIPGIGVFALIVVAGSIAMVLGLLSWRVVERPALTLKPDARRVAAPMG